jgi:hypothetical protein
MTWEDKDWMKKRGCEEGEGVSEEGNRIICSISHNKLHGLHLDAPKYKIL